MRLLVPLAKRKGRNCVAAADKQVPHPMFVDRIAYKLGVISSHDHVMCLCTKEVNRVSKILM
jgi:tetrahydromethanopterin S-methyltransferase subunit E